MTLYAVIGLRVSLTLCVVHLQMLAYIFCKITLTSLNIFRILTERKEEVNGWLTSSVKK